MDSNEGNPTLTKQVAFLTKIMRIENISFVKAVELINKLNEANLLDVYLDMHKEELEVW